MSRAWDKEKIWVPDGNRIHDLCYSKVVATIGEDVCQALVGLHSFTWCDTFGAFAGKGKLLALKIVKSDNDAKQALSSQTMMQSKTFCGASRRWPALSTHLGQMQVTWMILDTIFSLRRIERFSATSYHLAKTACESTPCGQTIKRVFGGAVCSVAHQSLTLLDSDGRWEALQKTNQV